MFRPLDAGLQAVTVLTMEAMSTRSRPAWSEQLVQGDRKVSNASAGGVKDSVCDRGRHAGHADLSQSDNSERHGWVGLVEPGDVDRRDVGVDRQIVGVEAGAHIAAAARVNQRLLRERHADTHDDGAAELERAR